MSPQYLRTAREIGVVQFIPDRHTSLPSDPGQSRTLGTLLPFSYLAPFHLFLRDEFISVPVSTYKL